VQTMRRDHSFKRFRLQTQERNLVTVGGLRKEKFFLAFISFTGWGFIVIFTLDSLPS
jgi:hypothetical protein